MFKTTKLAEGNKNQLDYFKLILIVLIIYQASFLLMFSKYLPNRYPNTLFFPVPTFSGNLSQNVSPA